jgi:hypothetical protein
MNYQGKSPSRSSKVTSSRSIGVLRKQRKKSFSRLCALTYPMTHRSLSNSLSFLHFHSISRSIKWHWCRLLKSSTCTYRFLLFTESTDHWTRSLFDVHRYRHELFGNGFGIEWMDDSDDEPGKTITEESTSEQESSNQINARQSRSIITVRSIENKATCLPAHIWRSLAKVQ